VCPRAHVHQRGFAEIRRHTTSTFGLPRAEKTQTAPQPASCETGVSYNQGRQEAASLRATNVGNLAAALHAVDLAPAKIGPAADAADDLRLAAGCRPSGGAVDSSPQAVTSRMCASGSQDERGLASASVNAVALGVYVLPAPLRIAGLFLCRSTAFVTESGCVVGGSGL
jgi:hypothetical protein